MKNTRENQRARIAFVVYYPFQYYIYKNVFKHLADEAEFLIDLGPYFPVRPTPDTRSAIVTLFEKERVPYRILEWEDYARNRVDSMLEKYDTLISVWLRGCINTRKAAQLRRAHMTYGAGKELTTFGLYKRHFDLILAYGEYDHAFYSLITNSIIVGNPKFDDWFSNKIRGIATIDERLDTNKKTLLYLPTHSDLSSIAQLQEELRSLADTYNIIVKFHYFTPREEPWLVKAFDDARIILLLDDVDLLPLLRYADIVVSDNSSAMFDAMLADKPIVVTDFHSPEYLRNEHWRNRFYRRGVAGPLTYHNSIEQRVKHDGTVDTISSPNELRPTIARILQHDEKQARRSKLVQNLFAYRDGLSGQRAAAAIRTLRTNPLPEKPFLHYAAAYYQMCIIRDVIASQPQGVRLKRFWTDFKYWLRSVIKR